MPDTDFSKRTIACGFENLLKSEPFAGITVDDICDNAGVSRSTFYRHFKDKYEILSWKYYTDFASTIAPRGELSIWDYTSLLCKYVYSEKDFYAKAFQIVGQKSLRDYCCESAYQYFVHHYISVFENKEIEQFYFSHTCNALFDALCLWLNSNSPMSPEMFSAKLFGSVKDFFRFAQVLTEQQERRLFSYYFDMLQANA